jgi:hypothetical protein
MQIRLQTILNKVTAGVAGTGGQAGMLRTANASSYIAVDAEL